MRKRFGFGRAAFVLWMLHSQEGPQGQRVVESVFMVFPL
jgi:hypothetical protein